MKSAEERPRKGKERIGDIVEKKRKEERQETQQPEKEPLEAPAEEPSKAPSEPEQDELAKCRAEAEDFKRKWYSVSAEYENYRKRTARESAQRYAEGRADVVKGLFPIADNLERALESCSDENTRKGIEMVLKSFGELLKAENIETIDPLGLAFDADTSEAIMAVDAGEGEESGTVTKVYRKGYRRGEKVLRFAQVVVVK